VKVEDEGWKMTDTEKEPLCCPRDGRPIDTKYIGKFSDDLWVAFCHCGYGHELVPPTKRGGK
jgi:hypothetical protein